MGTINNPIEHKPDSIQLPDSKSVLNRILLIERILDFKRELDLNTQCTDVQITYNSLWSDDKELDIQDAGTPYRFLTAYFASIGSNKKLICSEGMSKRPMKELVDILNDMGANISYLKDSGHPPLTIEGKINMPNKVALDASRSSQFLSAIMLVAPLFEKNVEITITEPSSSWPYILLTAQVMGEYGVEVNVKNSSIMVKKGKYSLPSSPLSIEKDWTAASYFYAISALTGKQLILENLNSQSIQGDSIGLNLFEKFGVSSDQKGKNLHLMHILENIDIPEVLNFEHNPDLAPTFIVLCSILGCDMKFIGLANLKLKESNRTLALQTELKKVGVLFEENGNSWQLNTSNLEFPEKVSFNTYEDHRIAMSLSLFMWVTNVHFDNPDVVKKSFPSFWNELLKLTLPEDE